VDALIEASDAALYDAKTNGRGRIAAAHPSPKQNIDQTPVSIPTARRP
jgi:hypothetical protein